MIEVENVDTIKRPKGATSRQWPRYLLSVASVIELIGGFNDWPALKGDLSKLTGSTLLGWIAVLKIAVFPLLAAAAFAFAVTNRLRPTLLVFAAMIFLSWLSNLPALSETGLDLQGNLFVNAQLLFQLVVMPLIALAITFLALSGERIGLSSLLAALPTIVNFIAVIAFAIGVGIYGF